MKRNAQLELTDEEVKATHEALLHLWHTAPDHPAVDTLDSVVEKLRAAALASCPVYHCTKCGDTYEEVRKLPILCVIPPDDPDDYITVCKIHFDVAVEAAREWANPDDLPKWEDLEVTEGKFFD
jgi:hypothetical protein